MIRSRRPSDKYRAGWNAIYGNTDRAQWRAHGREMKEMSKEAEKREAEPAPINDDALHAAYLFGREVQETAELSVRIELTNKAYENGRKAAWDECRRLVDEAKAMRPACPSCGWKEAGE